MGVICRVQKTKHNFYHTQLDFHGIQSCIIHHVSIMFMTKVPTRTGVIIIIIISCRVGPPAQRRSLCLPQLPYTRSPEISGRTIVVVGSGVESESELTAMQTMYNSLPRYRYRHRLLSVLNSDNFSWKTGFI